MQAQLLREVQPSEPDPSTSYGTWIRDWMGHLTGVSSSILVPSGATAITTPLVQVQWQRYLSNHPNNTLVNFFISGISQGCRLDFNRPLSQLKSARKNLSSAVLHPEVVDEYLAAELEKSRLAGPFSKLDIPYAHISRFGVIPKKVFPAVEIDCGPVASYRLQY